MRAYVIEHLDPPKRFIVIESRFGGYSFLLEEAAELIDKLLAALERANDPTPLPEAEPAIVHEPRNEKYKEASQLIADLIKEI